MIALVVAFALVGPAAAPAAPRRDFGRCLNRVVESRLGDKLAADAFKAAARAACASEETAFRTAWVAYEVGMKTKRADAEQDASAQIDDYLQNAVETYEDMVAPR